MSFRAQGPGRGYAVTVYAPNRGTCHEIRAADVVRPLPSRSTTTPSLASQPFPHRCGDRRRRPSLPSALPDVGHGRPRRAPRGCSAAGDSPPERRRSLLPARGSHRLRSANSSGRSGTEKEKEARSRAGSHGRDPAGHSPRHQGGGPHSYCSPEPSCSPTWSRAPRARGARVAAASLERAARVRAESSERPSSTKLASALGGRARTTRHVPEGSCVSRSRTR